MLLTTLFAIPLAGALLVLAIPGKQETLIKWSALAVSLGTLGFAGSLLTKLDLTSGALQLTESRNWIPYFGVSWAFGVDGISATLIVMATILVPLVIVAGWWDAENSGRGSVKIGRAHV